MKNRILKIAYNILTKNLLVIVTMLASCTGADNDRVRIEQGSNNDNNDIKVDMRKDNSKDKRIGIEGNNNSNNQTVLGDNNDITFIYPTEGDKLNSPKIRFKYLVCTGPYNNIFKETTSDNNKFQLKDGLFVINNNLTELLFKLEKGQGGVGTYTFIPEDLIDSVIGVQRQLWGEFDNNESFHNRISAEHKRALKKLRKYEFFFESFEFTSRNIRNTFGREYLPESSNIALDNLKDFDMDVKALLVIDIYSEHSRGRSGIRLSHNSIRNLILEIENISGEVLSELTIQVETTDGNNIHSLNRSKTIEEFKFPLRHLRPNEKILFPLSIKSVPFVHAERYIYEEDYDKYINFHTNNKENLIKLDSFMFFQTFEESSFTKVSKEELNQTENYSYYSEDFSFLDKDLTIDDFPLYVQFGKSYSEKSFYIDKNYKPLKITYQIQSIPSTVFSEHREIEPDNLMLVNDNCECGSCPIISYVNSNGKIRRIQEFLNFSNSKNTQDTFSINIPKDAHYILIEENKGETAYLSEIELLIKIKGDYYLVGELCDKKIVNYGYPLIFELESLVERFKIERNSIEGFCIRGLGYYESKTENICDLLLPIEDEYMR